MSQNADDATAAMILASEERFEPVHSLVTQSKHSALYVIFILLTILTNGIIIAFILASKAMRSSSRHVLIIGVCLGDLLMGVFVLPVLLHLGLQDSVDTVDCRVFTAMRLFADFLIPSVTTLAVLALNIDYLLRLGCSPYAEGSGRTALMVCLFLFPWLVSCGLLAPLYTDRLMTLTSTTVAERASSFDGHFTRILLVVSYFPQAFLLLVCNITVTVLYLLKRESFGLDVCGERIRAPVDICLASFVILLFYTPVFLITMLNTQGYVGCEGAGECQTLVSLYTAVIWFMMSKSWLMPFCWFVCRDTRACVRHTVGCC